MAVQLSAFQALAGYPSSTIRLAGTLFGDTAVSVVDLAGTVEPLSFTAVRSMLPDLPVSGEVRGSVGFAGSLEDLEIDVDLETPAGPLAAVGTVNVADLE
ncbi:MAG: hypothetical protein GWN39_10800, partial [Thermoplasmata archaeon]|nr:hypothetical protein [Thermoplasmata archaeon]